jgi:hypothetical protein
VARQKEVEAADSEPFEALLAKHAPDRKEKGHITVAKLSSLIQG